MESFTYIEAYWQEGDENAEAISCQYNMPATDMFKCSLKSYIFHVVHPYFTKTAHRVNASASDSAVIFDTVHLTDICIIIFIIIIISSNSSSTNSSSVININGSNKKYSKLSCYSPNATSFTLRTPMPSLPHKHTLGSDTGVSQMRDREYGADCQRHFDCLTLNTDNLIVY